MRCFYLLHEMALHHSVYVLTAQPEEDFKKVVLPAFPANVGIVSCSNQSLYRSAFNFLPEKIANAINFRILNRSVTASTDTSFLQIYPVLQAVLNEVKFDMIFYENLEAVSLLGSTVHRKSPSSIKVYDAHNVDSELWMQKAVSENKMLYKSYAKKALITEQSLFKNVDAFFCCSQCDNEKLTAINKDKISGTVIPNGVDTDANPFDLDAEKNRIHNIIFCGSLNYFPNKEGLLWFYKMVFPLLKEKLPAITLTVIGNVNDKGGYAFLQNDKSVRFVGRVESVVEYYHQSSVSVVPLKSGSGTRLKILEAMSLGNPVVSTSTGAEGIDYVDEKHLLISDEPTKFASHILSLLDNNEFFNQIRANALQLVKAKYDWKKIGTQMNEVIETLLSKKEAQANV